MSNTYCQDAFFQYDDIYCRWLHVRCRKLVLIKASEANKVVVHKHFALFSLLLHADVFNGQRMDSENFRQCLHFAVCWIMNVDPETSLFHHICQGFVLIVFWDLTD